MSKRLERWVAVATVCASFTPNLARAQSGDNKVAAEALFDAARKLMAEKQYAAACTKYEQSQRLDPGIGTLLYLADCYENAGRVASAWATFREGASQANAAGQQDRAQSGETRAARLEPRLSRLTINVAGENASLDGFVLRRGDGLIAKALWGVAVPVDGGDWVIEASAPKMKSWSKTLKVSAEKDVVSIDVPALEADPAAESAPAAAAPADAAPVAAPTPTPSPGSPVRDQSTTGDTQRTIGLIVGGVGVIGVGFGTYFGLRAYSKNSDAKELCNGAACSDQRGVSLTDDARDAARLSNVAFGVGLTALVCGTVVFLSAPSAKSTALSVTPAAGRRSAGLLVGGSF